MIFLLACAGHPVEQEARPGGAFEVAPPPGSGGLALVGPAEAVSGEVVTFVVTASDLAVGDRVELGTGTALGAGHCPYVRQTGGSPCLDITGRVAPLGDAIAVDDGGAVRATLEVRLVDVVDQVHVQAFLFRGASSATSNAITVDLTQAWSALDPRVAALEASLATLESDLVVHDHDDRYQPLDAHLTGIAAQTPAKGRLLVGDGSAWVALEPGGDGLALVADAGEPAGVRWAEVATTQEGTWTPTLSAASGAYGAVTYASSVFGTWRKTGRLVHVMFGFGTDAVSVGTASGQVILEGLPFPVTDDVAAAGTAYASTLVSFQTGWVAAPYLMSLAAGDTGIYLRSASGPAGSTPLLVSGLGLGVGANVVVSELTYLTD
ncbi:MAG TPA: hypothetical protein PKA64_25790 [Myxococcota bacterium]|nr:hypothetical protein [Myxococcota bacterium]